MNRVALLVGTSGALKGERFRVTEAGLMVGRDPDCAVSIPDPGVSRQHARVLLHNSAVWVQDAGSRNGVFVNGKRVSRPKQLGPGDEMTVGDHSFTVELAPDLTDEASVSVVRPLREAPAPRSLGWLVVVALVFLVAGVFVLVAVTR